MQNNKVMLIVLDGWGIAKKSPSNGITESSTPNFNYLKKNFLYKEIEAAGAAVGLPRGQMGNSEVGHMAMGAGRIILQDLPRISESIKNKSFFKNQELKKLLSYAKAKNKKIHMLGLLSDGGVHSHEKHLWAIMEYAKKEKASNVYFHIFTDGRDVGPKTAVRYIARLEKKIKELGLGKIATISGRYYAMDRDKRWQRTKKAYDAMVLGEGHHSVSAKQAVLDSYSKKIDDEFIEPTIVNSEGTINDGDCVLFFNYRDDRPRQISSALIGKDFRYFKRLKVLKNVYFVSMMKYGDDLKYKGVLFPKSDIKDTLAETLSKKSIKQFHLAETEKYPHVTFFFNGEREKPFLKEDRLMVNSPKVSTYDKKPEMSAAKVTKELLSQISKYDFVVVNFANGDMVGHTGKIPAVKKAIKTVDECLGLVYKKALELGFSILITGDHGNAEKMRNDDGTPCTTHTANKVPFIFIGFGYKLRKLNKYTIASMGPTILDILNLPKPKMMTEPSLLDKKK